MRLARILTLACACAAAVVLAGCGEIKNTVTPKPGTANDIIVALPGPFNANYIGLYDAQALGYFQRADLDVTFESASVGSDPSTTLSEVWAGKAFVAVSSEPAVLLARNAAEAVVSVAALFQNDPLTVTQQVGATGGTGPTSSTTTTTPTATTATTTTTPTSTTPTSTTPTTSTNSKVTYHTVPDNSVLPTELQTRTDLPPYQGLVLAVRKATIVADTSPIRRFVQAVARGYRAVQRDPAGAVNNAITVDPSLASQKAVLLAGVQVALPSFFPADTKHVWGWQEATEWNAFGTWLSREKLLTNPNATPDASTNELLQGQGV